MPVVEENVLNERIYVHRPRQGFHPHYNKKLRRNCILLKRMGRITVERSRVGDANNEKRRSMTRVKFRQQLVESHNVLRSRNTSNVIL